MLFKFPFSCIALESDLDRGIKAGLIYYGNGRIDRTGIVNYDITSDTGKIITCSPTWFYNNYRMVRIGKEG